MGVKTLTWVPNITANVIAQRVYWRQKTVGGAFLTTNFSPANDLPTSATTAQATNLLDNVVYEFQQANICTVGGPTFNTEGIKEGLNFACVTPTETHTDTTITGTVSGLPSDITKVRFTLYDSTGAIVVVAASDIVTAGGTASRTFTGLTASTGYIVRVELIAVVNGAEVVSTFNTCQVAVTTNAPSACPAPTGLTVS